ncbi:uncharacterized protein LOC9635275 isoform X1 [Selaginella moellendorffii]|uniref:uncharacterized protein LOC9635275 isoform X1 n=1 Tax=Selaginella moellendorffii TaxID=88036 RepID=UPI000D1C675B|nr:uncharacterized protein LOC9635275 isoform X1 [Selaginella moellendorffii]|eukprot:XP_024526581.1 uncharacterized protein LOC9635275 isoform X1 [Selaginella moellendorffii]
MALARTRYERARWGGRRDTAEKSVHSMSSSSLQAFYLNTLQLEADAIEFAAGGYGSIFKGTVATGFQIPERLERGRYLPYGQKTDEAPDFSKPSERVPVAVKKIREPENDDEVLEMTREGINMRVVQGARNVVTVYGVAYSKELECVCLVMELVQGPQLDAFLKAHHPPVPDAAWWKTKLELFMELVIGLSVCHQNGVYHGDLKGSNVLVVDESRVPKLIDFGFSFRKRDIAYLKETIGGSPFWVSPELCDQDEQKVLQEVMRNPYPSDFYSLGMTLVEMFLDGEVPEQLSAGFIEEKIYGGFPVSLEVPPGMEAFEPVFTKLFQVVEGCCMSDRDERISLQQCLAEVQAAYDELCNIGCSFNEDFLRDPSKLASTEAYTAVLPAFKAKFPGVPDAVFLQPADNMVVDTKVNTLVDLFCDMDYGEGVESIVRWRWSIVKIKLDEEVPRLCRRCVQAGSPKALKVLCSRWREISKQDEWLLHEACEADSAEVLQVLLQDFKMDYNTWHRRWPLKPLHKLSYQGKTEMMKIVLDRAKLSGRRDYVNDEIAGRTPLYYAVAGDKIDAVFFLLEQGANSLGQEDELTSSDFLDNLLGAAAESVSLNVIAVLSEVSSSLRTTGTAVGLEGKAAQLFRNHYSSRLAYLKIEGDRLLELKKHLEESSRRGLDAFSFGCSREGNAEVFETIVSIKETPRDLWRHLIGYGSREMVAYALDKLGYLATLDLIHLASKQGNLEVMDFLTVLMDRRKRVGEAEKTLKEMLGGFRETEEQVLENKQQLQEDDLQLGQGKEEQTKFDGSSSSEEKVAKDDLQVPEDEKSGLQVMEELEEDEVESSSELVTDGGELPELKFRRMFDYEYWDVLNEWTTCRNMNTEWILGEFHRISPDSWTETSQKLLLIAAQLGDETMVEKLLGKKVSPDFEEEDGVSPLYQSVLWEHEEIAQMLLRAGANASDSCMDAALDVGNGSLARLLIKFGFDTGRKNGSNQTYMDLIKVMDAKKEEFRERYEMPFFAAMHGEFP